MKQTKAIITTLIVFLASCTSLPVTSKALENNSDQLIWQTAWYEGHRDSPFTGESKKISPKSIFITPNLDQNPASCPPGFKIDDKGKCIKVISINQDDLAVTRLQNFLQQHQTTDDSTSIDYDYSENDSEATHYDLPLIPIIDGNNTSVIQESPVFGESFRDRNNSSDSDVFTATSTTADYLINSTNNETEKKNTFSVEKTENSSDINVKESDINSDQNDTTTVVESADTTPAFGDQFEDESNYTTTTTSNEFVIKDLEKPLAETTISSDSQLGDYFDAMLQNDSLLIDDSFTYDNTTNTEFDVTTVEMTNVDESSDDSSGEKAPVEVFDENKALEDLLNRMKASTDNPPKIEELLSSTELSSLENLSSENLNNQKDTVKLTSSEKASIELSSYEKAPFEILSDGKAPIELSSYEKSPTEFSTYEKAQTELSNNRKASSEHSNNRKFAAELSNSERAPINFSSHKKSPNKHLNPGTASIKLSSNEKSSIKLSGAGIASMKLSSNEKSPIKLSSSERSPAELSSFEKAPVELSNYEKPQNEPSRYEKPPTELFNSEKVSINLSSYEKAPTKLSNSKKPTINLSSHEKSPINLSSSENASIELSSFEKASEDNIKYEKIPSVTPIETIEDFSTKAPIAVLSKVPVKLLNEAQSSEQSFTKFVTVEKTSSKPSVVNGPFLIFGQPFTRPSTEALKVDKILPESSSTASFELLSSSRPTSIENFEYSTFDKTFKPSTAESLKPFFEFSADENLKRQNTNKTELSTPNPPTTPQSFEFTPNSFPYENRIIKDDQQNRELESVEEANKFVYHHLPSEDVSTQPPVVRFPSQQRVRFPDEPSTRTPTSFSWPRDNSGLLRFWQKQPLINDFSRGLSSFHRRTSYRRNYR